MDLRRIMTRLALALLLLTCSAMPSWAADLTLSVRDGLVSLDAQDVTVRQILTEWARVGKTRVVNVERITGGPITLKLDAVPEKQALDIVLRSIPGYMAMPRSAQVADASLYDRILIMPTTTAVAALRPQQPGPTFTGMQGGPNGNFTQLRQAQPTPLSPGMVLDSPNSAEQMDDPAMAAAAAAGLIPAPALNPGPSPTPAPAMRPGPAPQPAQTAPGAVVPTNPWNAPIGTPQPSLAPPAPVEQAPAGRGVRPPQPDR
jgi:hypothetical protein